jgi:hypothetical protein
MEIANQSRPLSPAEALARLSVVSLIQLIGFIATLLLIWIAPKWFDATTVAAWQVDCLKIALALGLITLIGLLVILPVGFLWWNARFPEITIWVIFGINTIFFVLGMARTGGPAHSFFTPLVPIQLSGILVLEQQKAMLTNARLITWPFALFSILAWIGGMAFSAHFKEWLAWKELSMDPSLEGFAVFATTSLFALSMGVTVFAYWAPLRPEFISLIQRIRSRFRE